MSYDLKPMKAPRAAGQLLKAFVVAVENSVTGGLLANKLLTDAGVTGLRELEANDAPATRHPVFDHGQSPVERNYQSPPLQPLVDALPSTRPAGFWPETAEDFVAAYRAGETDPEKVAQRAIEAVGQSEQRDPAMRTMIAQQRDDVLDQARAAAQRYRDGATLGPLDGVPVAIKDELDQAPYPSTVGTTFLGRTAVSQDADVVRRLREAGALLIGKTNMHEMGLGVTGVNPHHGAARNPHDPSRVTGGSSSGTAAAVASGLCPIAIGADGGGSVRIPAALCGIVGLKATFGRISEHGAAPLCWSVAHVGPLAATVRDTALAYAIMAGPDPKDTNSTWQPRPDFSGLEQHDLAGLRLGIYRPWFEDAEPDVVQGCQRLVDQLTEAGAEVRPITIPELGVLRAAHLVTIVSEMAAAHLQHYRAHRDAYGLDTRLNLALGRRLQAYDYMHAQRHRTRLCGHFAKVLNQVDAIITPSTGRTAPPVPTDALTTGESNLTVTDRIMLFGPPANLTGLPAITVPAGYDRDNLPFGMQIMGRPWHEHDLLRVAAVAEQHVPRKQPLVHYRYLS